MVTKFQSLQASTVTRPMDTADLGCDFCNARRVSGTAYTLSSVETGWENFDIPNIKISIPRVTTAFQGTWVEVGTSMAASQMGLEFATNRDWDFQGYARR